MDTFNAGVQYNDFKGTVAADISDNVALADYLVSLGKAERDERVVGFSIASGENQGTPVTDASLVAYLLRSADFEPDQAAVRAVEVSVTPRAATAFFKRANIMATRHGVNSHEIQENG